MKVLMLGWELPPFHTGGLGEACLRLANALSQKGADITFVLPRSQKVNVNSFKVVFADIDESTIVKHGSSYTSSSEYASLFSKDEIPKDFVSGAYKFAQKIEKIVSKNKSDIIHTHDWMTYPAGIVAKSLTNKPLVSHIHSTEFDRTGGNYPNQIVYEIEKKGFSESDKLLPVSSRMITNLVNDYGVNKDKVKVIYNGINGEKKYLTPALTSYKEMGYKVVLYFGRITLQKGPEYFVQAAKIILRFSPKTIFVVGGTGDMQNFMIMEAARLGIIDKFIFTGALWEEERDRIFQSADIYIMPSVSEPFGITALEAVANRTPVLISKQSGVSEVLKNCLRVDFWDIDEIANKVVSLLKFKSLGRDLRTESLKEIPNMTWDKSADKVMEVYRELL